MLSSTPRTAPRDLASSIHSLPLGEQTWDRLGPDGKRNAREIRELVRSIEPDLRHLARRISRRKWVLDEDDLFQRGLEVAYERAPAFEAERGKCFCAFVYKRAHGAMLDACRREKTRAFATTVMLEDHDAVGAVGSFEEVVLEEEEAALLRRRVGDALARLEPAERELLEACVIRGMAVAEVAREMGIGSSTAWDRLAKVKGKVARALR